MKYLKKEMRDKLIVIIEKHGLWFFCLWCVFLVIALSSCDKEYKTIIDRQANIRNNAEEVNAKIYKTMYDSEIIETFEMDGYKLILWHNGYGSDMEVIPIENSTINRKCKELWEENQIFSSMLAEIENEPGGSEILKKLWDEHNR